MTGVEAKDVLGKGDYEYAVPFYGIRKPILIDLVLKSDEEIERNYFNIERKGGILEGEAYMPNLKGGETYLFGTATALCDSRGNIVGAIESIRDITERRRAEEALRKAHDELERRVKERTAELESRNAEMERFVYTVSHELRSPLISVGGVLGILKKDLEIGDAEVVGNDLRFDRKCRHQDGQATRRDPGAVQDRSGCEPDGERALRRDRQRSPGPDSR